VRIFVTWVGGFGVGGCSEQWFSFLIGTCRFEEVLLFGWFWFVCVCS